MQKWILYIMTFFCCLAGKGQIIESFLKPDSFSVCSDALSIDKSIYILKSERSTFWGSVGLNPTLYKFNNQLQVIDSLNIQNWLPSSTFMSWSYFNPLASNDKDTLAIGINALRTTANDTLFNSCVILFDTNFAFIDTLWLSTMSDSNKYSIRCVAFENGKIQIGGAISSQTINSSDGFIMELGTDGIILYQTILPHSVLPDSYLYPYVAISDVALYNGNYIATLYPYYLELIAVFDSSLQLIKIDEMRDSALLVSGNSQLLPMPNGFPKLLTMVAHDISDTITLPPPVGFDQRYKNIGLISMNSSYSFQSLDTFYYTKNRIYDTIFEFDTKLNFGSFAGNLNRDSVLIMATNIDVDPSFYYKPVTWTYIHNINANTGQKHWSKIYQNGYAHDAQRVTQLPGNRWLLIFNEYNWDKYQGESLCIHMIVVDGNGNPIGITENEELSLNQEPILYPNPAKSHINVNGLLWPGNQYRFTLSTLNGQTVQQGALYQNEPILVSPELYGVYILSIVNQTNFGWAKKIIID